MTSQLRIIKYQDFKKEISERLKKTIVDAKSINTKYQKYLLDNPYKSERKELLEKKKKLIEIAIKLMEQNINTFEESKYSKLLI